jgi:hypothetical protein
MKALAAAAAPGLGLLIYAAFVWNLTGQPLAFAASHAAATYQGLGTLVTHQCSILANAGLSGYVGTPGYDVLNAIGAIFAIATIWPVTRRIGRLRVVHGVSTPSRRSPTAVCFRPGELSSVLFRRSSGSPRWFRRTSVQPDRHVRRAAGLRRGAVLHVATALLTPVTRRPLLAASRCWRR